MMGSGFGFGHPGLGMVLFWGLIVLFIIWLVRSLTGDHAERGKSAVQGEMRSSGGQAGRWEVLGSGFSGRKRADFTEQATGNFAAAKAPLTSF